MGVKNAFLGKLLASSDKFTDEQVAQTINLLVEHAVTHGASDIHIEPHDRFVQVRYRIDNVLKGTHKLPLAALPAVVAQIKDLAHLKGGEILVPQEGQYATLVGEEQFEVQVYTMPVVGGEKVLLHISRRLDKPPTLAALGFWGDGLHTLQQVLSRTHGLVIMATPRRNGKTTALHSMLQMVNTPAISIATVEESLEYRISGASQTIVRPQQGITHFEGLQAVLNQDPNVIMISNVTDKASADAVVRAAAGGHIVLAGMHADNAAAATAHLQSMTEEGFLFATALRAAVSQRLVRRLCNHCRESYQPSPDELRSIEKSFGIGSTVARQKIHQLETAAVREGLGGKTATTTPQGITTLWRASDDGCQACNHTGYQGAIAVVEVLSIEKNTLEGTLLTSVTADKVRKAALKDGFIPMELDGLIKALCGQTTLAELLRIFAI